MIVFPDAQKIQTHLMASPFLNDESLKQKGVDKLISEFAANLFAGEKFSTIIFIEIKAERVCDELKTTYVMNPDKFPPNIAGDRNFWLQIRRSLVEELKKVCEHRDIDHVL